MKKILMIGLLCSLALPLSYTVASKLYLKPSTGQFVLGCPMHLDIMIDTQGQATNTVDIKIFDNDDFDIIDMNTEGGIFSTYIQPKLSRARHPAYKGKAAIYMMGTLSSSNGFDGTGKFGTIVVMPKSFDNIELEFYMAPGYNGDDSNVSFVQNDTVIDSLQYAEGGHYELGSGTCPIYTSTNIIQQKEKGLDPLLLASLNTGSVDSNGALIPRIKTELIVDNRTNWEIFMDWLASQIDKVAELF